MNPAPEPLSRRPGESRASARRDEILDAATTLFARHGYSDAVTQALAETLQVGKGTIYRHFPSKEALFLATVDRVMRRMRERIDSDVETIVDPLARIEQAIHSYLAFFAAHPEFVELLIQERASFKDRKTPTYFEHREKNVVVWRDLFRTLIADGRVRPLPAEQITDILSNMMYGRMFTNYFIGQDQPSEVQAREMLEIFFRGILSDAERLRPDHDPARPEDLRR